MQHQQAVIQTESAKPLFQAAADRIPTQNTSQAIHFIMNGADKRRDLAYKRAKTLQREMGVIPTLVSVK